MNFDFLRDLGLSIREVWAVEKLFENLGNMFSSFSIKGFISSFMVVVENGGYGRQTCVPVLAPVLEACKAVLDAA